MYRSSGDHKQVNKLLKKVNLTEKLSNQNKKKKD